MTIYHFFEVNMNKQDAVKIVEAFWAAVWQGKDFDAIDRFCVEDFVITSGGVDVVSRGRCCINRI
jgi:ketosteroid isomerase-like protein